MLDQLLEWMINGSLVSELVKMDDRNCGGEGEHLTVNRTTARRKQNQIKTVDRSCTDVNPFVRDTRETEIENIPYQEIGILSLGLDTIKRQS